MTLFFILLAIAGVIWLLGWLAQRGEPVPPIFTAAADAEKKLVNDAKAAGSAFKAELSQNNADPNKPKA